MRYLVLILTIALSYASHSWEGPWKVTSIDGENCCSPAVNSRVQITAVGTILVLAGEWTGSGSDCSDYSLQGTSDVFLPFDKTAHFEIEDNVAYSDTITGYIYNHASITEIPNHADIATIGSIQGQKKCTWAFERLSSQLLYVSFVLMIAILSILIF